MRDRNSGESETSRVVPQIQGDVLTLVGIFRVCVEVVKETQRKDLGSKAVRVTAA
jgi:hypothetical protein